MPGNRLTFDVHAFCALPLVRRVYQALVVGLAVFIVTLVVLREPFRGYLAEVRISGPAMEGLDLDAAANWLKQVDREVAAVSSRGESASKAQLRATYVAPRASAATRRLDELAERWLYQYLPNRLMAHRHGALTALRSAAQAARDREDAARLRLESARQQQIVQSLRSSEGQREEGQDLGAKARELPSLAEVTRAQESPGKPAVPMVGAVSAVRSPAEEKLEALRLELWRLLSNFTENHPQVITLKAEIATLEKQLTEPASGPVRPERRGGERSLEILPPTNTREIKTDSSQSPSQVKSAQHFTTIAAAPSAKVDEAAGSVAAADVDGLVVALSATSRERQAAEDRLSERMQELSNQSAASQWSAAPAAVVTRLGGTPRLSTLALASLLAGVASSAIFRAAACQPASPKIESTRELASALELPVVGNLSSLRAAAGRIRRRLLTPGRLKIVMHASEVIVGLAVAACLVSIVLEPALSRQVLADPFGTLSEVIGRMGR
jgi:hypothetical protein